MFTFSKLIDYNISTAEQLAGLAQIVNEGGSVSGITFNLTKDIVLNDTKGWENWYEKPPKNVWTPIGDTGNPIRGYTPFTGLFNGNGHTISARMPQNYI